MDALSDEVAPAARVCCSAAAYLSRCAAAAAAAAAATQPCLILSVKLPSDVHLLVLI